MTISFIKSRVMQPVLLGIAANIIINMLMNPGNVTFIPEEFIAAILLSIPITELDRYIDRKLESRINWTSKPMKRFLVHLTIIFILLILFLNTVGNIYLVLTQQGFFSLKEVLTINIVTFCLAILLSCLKWGIDFHHRWMLAENNISNVLKEIEELKLQLVPPASFVDIVKGSSKVRMETQSICVARIEFGTVRIHSESGLCGIFSGSITQLSTLLPASLFFQVSREMIVHKKLIESISPSAFGKISITLHGNYTEGQSFTVSRPKAAAFRKWYYSIPG